MRWRNSSGQRIRLPSSARMNDSECCCGFEFCDQCFDDIASTEVVVTLGGILDGTCNTCDEWNGTWVLPFAPGVSPGCRWQLDFTSGLFPAGCFPNPLSWRFLDVVMNSYVTFPSGDIEHSITCSVVGFNGRGDQEYMAWQDTSDEPYPCVGATYNLPLYSGFIPNNCDVLTTPATCTVTF